MKHQQSRSANFLLIHHKVRIESEYPPAYNSTSSTRWDVHTVSYEEVSRIDSKPLGSWYPRDSAYLIQNWMSNPQRWWYPWPSSISFVSWGECQHSRIVRKPPQMSYDAAYLDSLTWNHMKVYPVTLIWIIWRALAVVFQFCECMHESMTAWVHGIGLYD